jgi:phage anti-repressor protein
MNNLPQVCQIEIGDKTIASVNARDLHESLGIRRDFSAWIKQYTQPKKEETRDWFENIDFSILLPIGGEQDWGGQNRIDYVLSVETAGGVSSEGTRQ